MKILVPQEHFLLGQMDVRLMYYVVDTKSEDITLLAAPNCISGLDLVVCNMALF